MIMPQPIVRLSATSTAAPMGMAKALSAPPITPPAATHFAASKRAHMPLDDCQHQLRPAPAPTAAPPAGVINCIAAKPRPSRICSPSSKTAISKARYLILLSSRFGFFLPQCKDLRRIGGDYLVLGVAGDDFDCDMLEAGKEYSLSHIGLQQQKLLFVGEVEGFLQA